MILRCMIVDDEPKAVSLLEVLIGQATGWQLVAKCYSGLEAIAFLKNNEIDLVFMDINMPLVNGMDLAALLSPDIGIVFTTAYSEYAAESYSYHTIDYLLKPITLKRFLAAVRKTEEHFKAHRITAKEENGIAGDEYFFVKSGKEHRKILLNDILFFESQKEYVQVVTPSFSLLTYRRLKDIEAQLPTGFIRVHQSFIVNMRQIMRIQDNHIHIGEIRIPVGEKFRDSLMELIRKRTF
ncbi:LytTR family DNA-binding domain-containing protein [Chitinophaga sp. CF418]|uniref:LytR/AlgR family response regulator transcription factor n=1 Tax=Chitinophaga sp. CF418 TaxID=1855287 RepID=UPI00091E4B8B|nr:LytTR family DNA-binding domain-containing protein [Chitinophaga sp. CF418]SHN09622.1 two component transcriptional regulator, LytTR family [Chitinophaga sp. CF418]